ncbi:MAG: YqgE/AlgH family protein, partial [Methylococcales bacterium]|nr:YqgE/AlgH family protein [Methylococcales bacterium]
RPMPTLLGEIFLHMDIESQNCTLNEQPIFEGGPIQPERGFVLHKPAGEWESSINITNGLAVATSTDILEAIANNKGPKQALIALGYAGWESGQLEDEILNNAWLHGPASTDILFNTPSEKRWEAAAALIGIDVNLLTHQPGHG